MLHEKNKTRARNTQTTIIKKKNQTLVFLKNKYKFYLNKYLFVSLSEKYSKKRCSRYFSQFFQK